MTAQNNQLLSGRIGHLNPKFGAICLQKDALYRVHTLWPQHALLHNHSSRGEQPSLTRQLVPV